MMTVITLSKVPYGLRGYLSRWMVEIAIGVFVGNLTSKVREAVWEEVKGMSQRGEATMTHSHRNEQGFITQAHGGGRDARDHDGMTLIWKPKTEG